MKEKKKMMKKQLRTRCATFGLGLVLCIGTAACGNGRGPAPEAEDESSATAYIIKADGTKVYPDEEHGDTSVFNSNADEDREDPEDETEEPDAEENSDEDLLGSHTEKVYENPYFGIGCKLKDNWEFMDDEALQQLSQDAANWMDNSEEVLELLESGRILQSMSADPKEGGASLSVNVEKLGFKYIGYTAEEYDRLTKEDLRLSLEAAGIEVREIRTVTMNVFGEKRDILHLTLVAEGTTIDEFVVHVVRDGYMATCTAASAYGYDEAASLLDCYFALH